MSDPVKPEYEDLQVSLQFIVDDEFVMVFSLKNHQIIRDKQIHYENSACLPVGTYDEAYLNIIYNSKI
ncbi:hypothetical protein MNBD_GAMMA02-1004 [hydrothermal vent metagenome]|uniref:Uncharacterized protein n=1 Tax=hydrothermal vent metagenome TaxID=652676 RepID=A0A3B0VKS6_9ZZZZ